LVIIGLLLGKTGKRIWQRERQGFLMFRGAKHLEVLTANELIAKFLKWEPVIADHPTDSGDM
jgi:hypothetical protein